MRILWEDSHLIFAEKPMGLLSQPAPGEAESMLSQLAHYRRSKGEPAEVLAVHRLDRSAGGVIVYAKDSRTAVRISALIQQQKISKEYTAILHGVPAISEGVCEDLLFRGAGRNKTYVVQRECHGVRPAHLDYRMMDTVNAQQETLALVYVRQHTGRTHQVRVQFASRGMPLWGDGKYDARDIGSTPALWCAGLQLSHPFTGQELTFDHSRRPVKSRGLFLRRGALYWKIRLGFYNFLLPSAKQPVNIYYKKEAT